MKLSSGTLLHRQGEKGLEVLLVHASGNYNRGKPWSIPKGEPDPEETDLEVTARRETREETGVEAGPLVYLGTIQYTKSRKVIHCYAGTAPEDASPRCASWEVDQARFVPIAQARELLHPEQQPLLDRLLAALEAQIFHHGEHRD